MAAGALVTKSPVMVTRAPLQAVITLTTALTAGYPMTAELPPMVPDMQAAAMLTAGNRKMETMVVVPDMQLAVVLTAGDLMMEMMVEVVADMPAAAQGANRLCLRPLGQPVSR